MSIPVPGDLVWCSGNSVRVWSAPFRPGQDDHDDVTFVDANARSSVFLVLASVFHRGQRQLLASSCGALGWQRAIRFDVVPRRGPP